MELVPLPQPAENRDGILHARLIDEDGLEAPLERAIFLDVLSIFIQRRGADAV